MRNPYVEEPTRSGTCASHVRDHLTDLYFSQHLPLELFEKIVREVLAANGVSRDRMMLR